MMLAISCIDPLNVNIDDEVNVLIVEGSISTLPGPFIIKLNRSARYGSIFDGYIRPVQNAKVSIRDSDGNNFKLIEQTNRVYDNFDTTSYLVPVGVYETPDNFVAKVGKSYTLLISTANGNEYTSIPETITRAATIDSLQTFFKKTPIRNEMSRTGLEVYAIYQDSPEERNFYRWVSKGTYQIITYPENFVIDSRDGSGPQPAPKGCCNECWVTESAADPLAYLVSDNNVNGNSVSSKVAFVEDDGFRFADKYFLEVKQYSLSREAFQFFKLLREQISIDGDIFDPPPATLRGNIINLTNPDENVIGYFSASDVTSKSIFLTPDMLTEPKVLVRVPDDCREVRNAIAQRPPYW